MQQDQEIIAVLGLGYVGLPLAIALSKHYRVIAYDINPDKVNELKNGQDYLYSINESQLNHNNLEFTCNESDINHASVYIVAVQTPVNHNREPDLSSLLQATKSIAANLDNDNIVVYEATVYPGVTEEECVPILEKYSSLKCDRDFDVAYSPERINPGDEMHALENTTKIISAQNQKTLERVSAIYSKIIKSSLHKTLNIKVAEAAKVIENTQRDINIALMNELSIIFHRLGIDTNDVIDAASTKWNFIGYRPGLVGGHCIGVDPYYLTYKSLKVGYSPRIILSGRSVNDSMGNYIARYVIKELVKTKKISKDTTISILGFSFKENVADIRNTRVADIVTELESYDLIVKVYDPVVNKTEVKDTYNIQIDDLNTLSSSDAVILAVSHHEFVEKGWWLVKQIAKEDAVVFDVKAILDRNIKPSKMNLFRL